MKPILVMALSAILCLGEAIGEPESISKIDLIEAYREFRAATVEFTAGMCAMFESASFASKKNEKVMKADRDRHYRASLPHVDKSIKLNPYFSPVYEMCATILRDAEGDIAGAVEAFSKAIELDPAQDAVIAARAELLLKLGRIEDARRDLAHLEERKSGLANGLRANIKTSEQAVPSDGHKPSSHVPSDGPTAPADAH
jgi:tetratricopeptide (TPR) repeat protein